MTNRASEPSPRAVMTGSRVLRLSGLGLLIGVLALVAGCSKPPPPPPANIRLEDISQEMRVDARVQVAPGMEVGPDQAELARAVLLLADAVAKGDAKAMRPMLTRGAQALLDELEADGRWAESTAKIEAVRIVTVQPGVNFAAAMAEPSPESLVGGDAIRSMMSQALAGLSEDQRKQVEAMLQQFTKDPSSLGSALDAGIAQAKSLGLPEEITRQLEAAKTQLATAIADAAPAPTGQTGIGVLLAIQEASGSYLLGWQADQVGDRWLFTNTPANSGERARASAWDGIGEAGFSDGAIAAADGPAAEPGRSNPGDAAPSAEPPPPSDSGGGPRKQNTPGGPVTIPGG